MLSIPRFKIVTILGTCLFGLIFACPNLFSPTKLENFPPWLRNTINLGLELRGGSHLQLEVDLKAVAGDYLTSLVEDIRTNLRQGKIGYTGLLTNSQSTTKTANISFTLKNTGDIETVKKLISAIDPSIAVTTVGEKVIVTLVKESLDLKNQAIINQSIEVIRRRIDESGTKEPIIQRQGQDRIIVQLPGVEDPSEVKRRIGQTAKMTFRLVDSSVSPIVAAVGAPSPYQSAPLGTEYLEETSDDKQIRYMPVKKQVMVAGESLIDAQATFNSTGQPAVSLKFNSKGARQFAEMSANNIKKQFAIVLDNKVISAPVFQDVISDGGGQISGHFTVKEANDLALLLRAGALPAPLKVIEERTVGPSLGADSIRDGQLATTVAFFLVSLFMILCYRTFGFFADIALFFNLVLLFAGLSLLQATLTLPGIAGIALTIGMAVDANVLIFERIKEELRLGMKAGAAINAGYRRAMTTIIDSNLTTLIGAAVLFEFGTGPIRGFAVTLALGILISLFTALSLTRLIINLWLGRQKVLSLPL